MPHSISSSSSTADLAKKFGPSLNLSAMRAVKTGHKNGPHLDKSLVESKRARLEELLSQQFLAKYGVRKDGAHLNKVITDAIHGFMVNTKELADISHGATSGELDVIVRHAIASNKNKAPKQLSQTVSLDNKPSSSLTSQQKQDLMLPINNKTEELRVNQWVILAEMDRVAEEKRKQKEIQERVEHQRELKQILDRQTREHEEQSERVRQEKTQLLHQSVSNAKLFQDEQEQLKLQKLKSFEVERNLRLQQMESRQRARQLERAKKVAEERIEMERVQRVVEDEERSKQQRKLEEKRMKELAILDNEKLRLSKMEEQRLLRDKDRDMMRDYAAKLEREEKTRTQAFQARMTALSKIGSMHHESVGSVVNAKEAEREAKERAAIEAKYQRDVEMERQKKERTKTITLEALKDNQLLVKEREKAKERERVEDRRMRERLDKENEEVRRKQEAQDKKKKAEAEATRQAQEQQAQERAKSKKAGLTDELDEVIANKLIREKVQADPELYKQALGKILTVRSERRPLMI